MKKIFVILFVLSSICLNGVFGQDIILDQPIRAGELTLFPSLRNQNEYYYLSDKPRLATNERGRPQFSFLRYVENQQSGANQPDLDEGDGGGIVHAVIELDVTNEQLDNAKQELRQVNPRGTIRGPAIYEGGTIALISSVSDPESGFSRQILGLGKAPILDGQKAAVSIQLTKLGAKVLWESFQTPTPDMSISFEMELEGYKSPKEAIIEANFDQIYSSESFQAGIISRQGGTVLAGEIDAAFEDQFRSGSIKVVQIGEDEDMEAALDDAYQKLTKMMFESSKGNPMALGQMSVPLQNNQKSVLDRAQEILDKGREDAKEDFELMKQSLKIEAFLNQGANQDEENKPGESNLNQNQRELIAQNGEEQAPGTSKDPAEGGAPDHWNIPPRAKEFDPPEMPSTAIVASYKLRQTRQRGVFRIDLQKYSVENLTIRFDENFGPVINCDECFREVSLDDPFFKQREIAAVMDGFNANDFGNYINYVSVTLQKEHQGGEYTTDDVRIDRSKFNQEGNNFKLLYGWKEDNDRRLWRNYKYRLVWNFFGGYTEETDWTTSSDNAIPLVPPLYIKSVDVEVDPEIMKEEGVRSVEVKLFYDLGNREQVKQIRLNLRAEETASRIELLQPVNQLQYEYEITWYLRDGSTKTSDRKEGGSLVIFADNL